MVTSSSTLTAPSNGEQAPEQVRAALVAARNLIEKPEHWCQGTYRCGATDDDCKYCSDGALLYCKKPNGSYGAALAALEAVTGGNVVRFNDAPGRTHAEVLAAFDTAIASLSHSDDRVQDSNSGAGA